MSRELDHIRSLTESALVMPGHYITAFVLTLAVTHKIDDFRTAPRFLALGEPGSGKSTVLEIASYLASHADTPTGINQMTAPAMKSTYFMEPRTTLILDEMNHLFGESGQNGKGSEKRGILNQGYKRRTAWVKHSRSDVTVKIPAFGVVFMAGLGMAAPTDMRERSIVIKMDKLKSKPDYIADLSKAETEGAFNYGQRVLESWAKRTGKLSTEDIEDAHPKLFGRLLDVWGPLFAVAKAAGDVWFKDCLEAFERIECDKPVPVYAPDDQLLSDYLAFVNHPGYDAADGVASGEFANFATELDSERGAYMGMKPGQFRQMAVSVLGPTTPFYDNSKSKTVRGWTDTVHAMNLQHAADRMAELEAKQADDESVTFYEDF